MKNDKNIEIGFYGEVLRQDSFMFPIQNRKDLEAYIRYLKKEQMTLVTIGEKEWNNIAMEYYENKIFTSDQTKLEIAETLQSSEAFFLKSHMKLILYRGKGQNEKSDHMIANIEKSQRKAENFCHRILYFEAKNTDYNDICSIIEREDTKDVRIIFYGQDANICAIKYRNYFSRHPHIRLLEREWGRYKYEILEHSQTHYNAIRILLKEKNVYPVVVFYQHIEEALAIPISIKTAINALDHVWGYFKNKSNIEEKQRYLDMKGAYKEGNMNLYDVKQYLWTLVLKYKEGYLYESSYFYMYRS